MGQTATSLLMVRPKSFGFNNQTYESNCFQNNTRKTDPGEIQKYALSEFDAAVKALLKRHVEVVVFDDTPSPPKPDAIFPNNWISFHEEGTVVLYPMLAPNRRAERRSDIPEKLNKQYGFNIKKIVDLSYFEKENKFLEGTGSIVFDYDNKVAYANRSPRTSPEILDKLCLKLGYKPVMFTAHMENGAPIYHTNVLMCIGDQYAIICTDSIPEKAEKKKIVNMLEESGHKVVSINYRQLYSFAGNMLQVRNKSGEPLLIMSQKAYQSLTVSQIDTLASFNDILPIAIPTIEKFGGGSIRCMIAALKLLKTP